MSGPNFLCSFDAASPLAGWTFANATIVPGRTGNGALIKNSDTNLSKDFSPSNNVSIGASLNLNAFANDFANVSNAGGVVLRLKHLGDGRLIFASPAGTGAQLTPPSSAVVSLSNWYCVELQCLTTALPDGTFQLLAVAYINQQVCLQYIEILQSAPAFTSAALGSPGGGTGCVVDNAYIDWTAGVEWGDLTVNPDDTTTQAPNPNVRATQVGIEIVAAVPQPLTLTCGSSVGFFERLYTSGLLATGGFDPLTYSFTGTLPPGLIFNATTGTIIGYPTAPGTYAYTGKVTDSLGTIATSSCTIVVTGSATPLTLACPVNEVAQLQIPYTGSLVSTGGLSPLTYQAFGLPPGLTVDASTGAITGIPTVLGPYLYTAKVTDSLGASDTIQCIFGVVLPIQPGSPCQAAAIQPQIATDVSFELERIYVWMKPAPRIPTRGS